MSERERKDSAAPVIGIVVAILAVLGLGFWFLARDPGRPKSAANLHADIATGTDTARNESPARRTVRAREGMGAGMLEAELPVFAGRDIHDVPLGEILDYAQRLPYDETRGHEEVLGKNESGQTVRVSIWPESGASSLESPTLRQGRIVARIESNHGYEALGLADGLNYLWVEERPGGGYQGVIIPATAFAPLHDLERVSLTERTPRGVPLEKGAYWVNGRPWVACGRC